MGKLGFVGLGKMGMNMVTRLRRDRHEVVAYDRAAELVSKAEAGGCLGASSLSDLVSKLDPPRAVWSMVPSGLPTEETVKALAELLEQGDFIIDGGNSHYKESVQRAEALAPRGIRFLDVGTSGGIWGLSVGYCLMIGGDREGFNRLEPVFKTLAPKEGYLYCGASGAGHFAKMIHNGIEYAMLQAYGEGFELLKASPFGFDFGKIAHLWNQGSVVRSWLLELAEDAFSKDATLEGFKAYVEDSGEGRWTVLEAVEQGVPAPAIATALFRRFRSREEEAFSDKFIAALRKEFGGHEPKTK